MKQHRAEGNATAAGDGTITDANLREYAALAAVKCPWPGLDGEAGVDAWFRHMSLEALKRHLASAINALDNTSLCRTYLIILCRIDGQESCELQCAAAEAIFQRLKDTIPTKTWYGAAVSLSLGGTWSDKLSANVVMSSQDAHTFHARYVRPSAPLRAKDLPDGALMKATLEAGKVLAVYGSSGAGKTFGALALACEVSDAKATVYCACTSEDIDSNLEKSYFEACDDAAKTTARNELAFAFAMSTIAYTIPKAHRKKPPPVDGTATAHDMVLVLDELGWAPHVVRGIIDQQHELRAAIKDRMHCAGKVHIIIVGTGVEAVCHGIGSTATTAFGAFHMRPLIWPKLAEEVGPRIAAFVDNERSPTAGLIRALVRNARCAALFANECDEWRMPQPATEATMTCVATRAVNRYRALNRLEELHTLSELVGAFTSAMAAQLSEATRPQLSVAMHKLKVSYGVLLDHGVRSQGDSVDHPVVAPPGGPRYEVEPAFEAMLWFLLGTSRRPPTGDGFEQAFADFAALSVTFAGMVATDPPPTSTTANTQGPPRDLFSHERVDAMLTHCKVIDDVPHGWRAPLTFVSWLRSHSLRGRSVAVNTVQAPCKIEPGNADTVHSMFADLARTTESSAARDALIVINGSQAQGADVIGLVPGSGTKGLIIMCQTKLNPLPMLHQHAVLFELHKLGCAAEIVLGGSWAHTVECEDLGELTTIDGVSVVAPKDKVNGEAAKAIVQREVLVQVIAEGLPKYVTFAAWLHAKVPSLSKRAVATQKRECDAQTALTAAVATGLGAGATSGGVDVAFVVAVYGDASPLSQDVKAQLPDNVLLLHDQPAATTTPSTAGCDSDHHRRLRGFYPVRVAHSGAAVPLFAVPATAHR